MLNKNKYAEYIQLYTHTSATEQVLPSEELSNLEISNLCVKALINIASQEIQIDNSILCSTNISMSDSLVKQREHNFNVLKHQNMLKMRAIAQLLHIVNPKHVIKTQEEEEAEVIEEVIEEEVIEEVIEEEVFDWEKDFSE